MPTRRVAVICAMPSEVRPVNKLLGLRKSELGGMPVYTGSVGDTHVVAALMGMGMEGATSTTERLLDTHSFDHVVVSGICGGVHPGVPIHLVIEPAVVLDWNTRAEFHPTPLAGTTPTGRMASCNDMLEEEHDQAELIREDIVAVDMETAAVAEVCERRGVPWTAYRVVSDRVGETDAAMFGLANQDGTPNLPKALRYIATHPRKVPYLMRLARDASRAARAAAEATAKALGK